MDAELSARFRENPGFIDVKSYRSEDGERLTVVWFRDEETLRQWRELERHRHAQRTGRERWYQYYDMEVATVTRESHFRTKETPVASEV
jgi:heme-degrading monooxygenase HmoA